MTARTSRLASVVPAAAPAATGRNVARPVTSRGASGPPSGCHGSGLPLAFRLFVSRRVKDRPVLDGRARKVVEK